VTDKDLEVLLSVIHLKLEAAMGNANVSTPVRPAMTDVESDEAWFRLRRLAVELQGVAWEYGYSDLFSLLGDVKRRHGLRNIRGAFLQTQFGYHYAFIPYWSTPFSGFN
jgi:hypothetical protein